MAKIVKVIEVLSESGNSWEEAAQNVVSEASKTAQHPFHLYQRVHRCGRERQGDELSRKRENHVRNGAGGLIRRLLIVPLLPDPFFARGFCAFTPESGAGLFRQMRDGAFRFRCG